MPESFDKREKSFEAKWVQDEELRFKVYARRNKLLGLWAASEMGIGDPKAAWGYAGEVIAAELEKTGDDDVFQKLRHDFDAKGIIHSDHTLRRKMAEFLEAAKDEIEHEARG